MCVRKFFDHSDVLFLDLGGGYRYVCFMIIHQNVHIHILHDYGLHFALPSSNSYVQALVSIVTVFGERAFNEVVKVK